MGGELLWGNKIDVPGSFISWRVLVDVRYRRRALHQMGRRNHGLFNVLGARLDCSSL